ncbi:MAG: MFS transporter, partial [Planctomycetaceae bacterium]|nr:MFS transporter [Planctomycetaceae bacterium]
ILSWSFFTAMIGGVSSFLLLMVARLGCGLGQAGAYPTSASIVSKWVPFSARGIASATISFGGRIGGAVAPLLTAFLIVLFVPMDTSPLLVETQLLNPTELAMALAKQSESPSAQNQIFKALPEETQTLCRSVSLDETLTESQKATLLEGLNQVIQSEGFYDENAFSDRRLKFTSEALGFLKRKRAGESLSEPEQQRLNRFLIEGVFPQEVGKLYTTGWRPVMFIYGGAGIGVALLFWFVVRSRPEVHPKCNQAERDLIASGRPSGGASPQKEAGRMPWKPLIENRSMWYCCLVQFGTNIGWVFLVTWFPRYLVDVHQVPILERGVMTSVPLFVGMAGMLFGGRLTDWMTLKFGIVWGRRLPMALTRFTAALGYILVLGLALLPEGAALKTPWVFVAAFSLVTFSTDLGTAAMWAYNQDVGGHYVGSILGWGNMWGNLGAGIAPSLIYDPILGENPAIGDWNTMFIVCAGVFVLSGLFGLGVDASSPIALRDDD